MHIRRQVSIDSLNVAVAADQLDQRHDRHPDSEVHAKHFIGPPGRGNRVS